MELPRLPRKSLAFLPTPLVELPRLAAAIARAGSGRGPRLFMKRDDQTGLACGGNKARKLEFLVGEALAQGCDSLITGGASQSNHCRQTAAAAAACGLGCHLVLGGSPPEGPPEGNLLLDLLLGAKIHWAGERRKGEDIPSVAEELRAAGGRPYVIPYGGSSALGAMGFAAAALELAGQLSELRLECSRIVFASSSGGTQAGLMVGSLMADPSSLPGGAFPELTGICIDKAEEEGVDFAQRVADIANGAAQLAGLRPGQKPGLAPRTTAPSPTFTAEQVGLRRDFTGGGYGVVGELERRAIRMAAESEGILVDPVYTARALGALIEMAESGEIGPGETVVFWHTGGSPALFARSRDILPAGSAAG